MNNLVELGLKAKKIALRRWISSTPSGFPPRPIGGIMRDMPALTRRRDRNLPQECWRIYYGDVHVGTIAQCVGNPGAAPRWQWRSGFYPGSRPGECSNGTAETFDEARAAFDAAWRVFVAKRTEADFEAWREHQAWTAEKYRRFDRGERMPADWRPATAQPSSLRKAWRRRAAGFQLEQEAGRDAVS